MLVIKPHPSWQAWLPGGALAGHSEPTADASCAREADHQPLTSIPGSPPTNTRSARHAEQLTRRAGYAGQVDLELACSQISLLPQGHEVAGRASLDDVDGRRAEDRQVTEHGCGVAGPVERG
jgi:hypothetical protein